MSSEEFKIVETRSLPSIRYCLIGMPDTGLTGMIAVTHVIHSLSLIEVGHLESELIPPVIVIHKGEPKDPIRFFGNEKLAAITSETPLSTVGMYPLARSIVNWAKSKKIELLISVSGIATQNRLEIENPLVYGVATLETAKELLDKAGIQLMEEGFMVGPHAIILKECMVNKVPNIVLLAQSHSQYPDPGASAAAINAINKLLDIKIDTQKLIEQAEDIRLRTRELMQRTTKSLRGMEKGHEQELPAMYG